ncbi:hypothetical protein [Streptomyces inhibens]|uniref:hypothetical protein n=1 Tax=Streptomyces inhibens TaxID=2293571 RepID=UPI001EE72E4F|nr:hypothetical protein [Streptomyces inhibens]UKY54716.1 hypothetical protein KI385_41945 [Streptomyces inhibens]
MTLLPLLLGKPAAWDLATAQTLIPSLLGHLAYGAVTVAVLALLSRRERQIGPGLLVRASAAGLFTAAVLGLGRHGLIVGALVGASYAVIFGDPARVAALPRFAAPPSASRGGCSRR